MGRGERWAVILMAILMFGVYFVLAAGTELWDRDEPRYARAAVEMWEGGDWLVPHVNDAPRLRKPPMIYWMMAPMVGVMGPTTVAVRMVSILCTIGAGLLTWLCGRRMFGPAVGLWSMGIFATCGLTIYVGAAALIDAALVMFTTLAVFCMIDRVYRARAWWHLPVVGLAMISVMLLKGPLVLPVPVLTIITAAILGRRGFRLGGRWWLGFALGAVLSIGALVAWALPTDIATGGALYEMGFKKHVVERMSTGMEGHGSSNLLEYIVMLPLYVPFLIACMFPWVLHLPGAVRAMLGKRLGGERERAILWGWALPWFVCVSLAATKLPHYLLPILPPLAIATAAGVALRLNERMNDQDRDWLRGGIWFFIPVAVLVLGAIAGAPLLVDDASLLAGVAPVAVALVVIGAAGVVYQLRERVALTTRLLMYGTPVVVLMSVVLVLPGVEDRLKVSRDLAGFIERQGLAGEPLHMHDYDEPSLFFYVDRPVGRPIVRLDRDEIGAWARRGGDGLLVISRERLEQVQQAHGPAPVRTRYAKPIIDYSSGGDPIEVLLVEPAGASGG